MSSEPHHDQVVWYLPQNREGMIRLSHAVHDPSVAPKELHRRAAEPLFRLNDQSNFQVNSLHVGPQDQRLGVRPFSVERSLAFQYGHRYRIFILKNLRTSREGCGELTLCPIFDLSLFTLSRLFSLTNSRPSQALNLSHVLSLPDPHSPSVDLSLSSSSFTGPFLGAYHDDFCLMIAGDVLSRRGHRDDPIHR